MIPRIMSDRVDERWKTLVDYDAATQLAFPTVHLGGTARSDLVDACVLALDALEAASVAMNQAMPNARDYPGAVETWLTASRQHRRRMTALAICIAEIGAVAERIVYPPTT